VTTDLAKNGQGDGEVKIDSPLYRQSDHDPPHAGSHQHRQEVATRKTWTKRSSCLNHPMGPFELMDLTGVDICKFVADYFYKELNKEGKWVAPTLLKNMIRANRLGRKTGAGWYDYKK
jgi:3-hydroxybutyryl-CoA dehydrogenase